MKRIASAILVLVMVFLSAACQAGSGQPSSGSNGVNSTAADADRTAGTPGAENAEKDLDAGNKESAETIENIENTQNSGSTDVSFPVTITDQAGRSLTIENEPKSIVSCYYISTSILMALGLEDRLVGIEDNAAKRPIYSLTAPQLLDLPNVGSVKEFDIESCVALKPDLTILSMRLKEAAATLEELGLKVVLIDPEDTQKLSDAITIIASATGTGTRGTELTAAMEKMYEDLDALTVGSGSPSVYMASNSAFLSTAGSKMFQSSMIENAGGTNVAAQIEDSYWSAISYEQLLSWNPEYIILAADAKYTVEDVLSDTSISECTAVKNGNVYKVPGDIEALDSPIPGGALGSIWLASILHGDKVSKEYYERSVSEFYGKFYGYRR